MTTFTRVAFIAAALVFGSASFAVTKKAPAKSTGSTTHAAPAAAATSSLPAAGADQVNASNMAHLGNYDCEFGKTISVEKASTEGYLNLKYQGQQWTMKPELSSTGALNLNDTHGRMRYLQIASKSMLMDASAGRRVVDGCQHATQKAFEAANK
jgi:hypothetical protein